MNRLISIIVCVLGMLYGSAEAATYYVATTGTDNAGCGAVGSPCLTIEYTYEKAAVGAGDTILVQPGTYTGGGSHTGYGRALLRKSGTVNAPITIKSVAHGVAILDGGADVNMPYYFYLEGADYNIIDGFVIHNTYRCGMSVWGSKNNKFINLEIHHPGTGYVVIGDCGVGIFADEASTGNYYGNNYFHDSPTHGVYLYGGNSNSTVANNLFANNGQFGAQIRGLSSNPMLNMKIYNNTFVSNGKSGIVIYEFMGSGVEIKNNIFYQNQYAAISLWDATGSGVVIDNNVSYGNVQGDIITGGVTTLSYTATNWIHSDPLFVDAAAKNFHLQAGSPALNVGLTLAGVTDDYDGVSRPQGSAYDIGAFEYIFFAPVNIALNKSAVASSLEDAAYPAAKAFDGNATTRWSSAFSDPQWIYVDLGANDTVTGVKLVWEAAYATSFQIQASTDAAAWADLYSTTTGTGGTQNLTVAPTTARYIRMYGTARATAYGYSLFEMEVYGDITPPAPGPRTMTFGGFTAKGAVTLK